MTGLRGAASIVGAGTYGLGEAPGLSELEITAGAVQAALDDAGLRPSDVDGVFCASMTFNMGSLTLCEYLGIAPKFSDSSMIGGSSSLAHLLTAMMAIATGQCDVALVAYGSNQRSMSGRLVSTSRPDPFESPYGPRQPITSYALAASRHMHEYGTTRKQLAEVATAARAWAAMNPDAFLREPLSIEDVLNSRPISDPFTVRDCCLVTDGGGAVILTSPERARDRRYVGPVHAFKRPGIRIARPQRIREKFASDLDLVPLGPCRLENGAHRLVRNRGFDEYRRDFFFGQKVRQPLNVAGPGFGSRRYPLETVDLKSPCAPEVAECIVGSDQYPPVRGYLFQLRPGPSAKFRQPAKVILGVGLIFIGTGRIGGREFRGYGRDRLRPEL